MCVVDCDSGRGRGQPSRCREMAYEAKCGCNEGRPERIGIMEYRVSFIIKITSDKIYFIKDIYSRHIIALVFMKYHNLVIC